MKPRILADAIHQLWISISGFESLGGQPNLFKQLRSFSCFPSGNWQHPAGNICFANTPAQGATPRYPAANSAGPMVGPIDTTGVLRTPLLCVLVAFRHREPRMALV